MTRDPQPYLNAWPEARRDTKRLTWRVRYRKRDGSVGSWGSFERKRDAVEAAAKVERQINGLEPSERLSGPLWDDACEEYFTSLTNISESHANETAAVLNGFSEFAAATRPADVKAVTIVKYLDQLRDQRRVVRYRNPCPECNYQPRWRDRDKSYSPCPECGWFQPASVWVQRKHWSTLRALFNYFLRAGYIQRTPMLNVREPDTPEPLVITPDDRDLIRLLEAVADYPDVKDRQGWHLLILAGYTLSLRRNQLLDLNVADVKLESGDELGLLLYRKSKQRKLVEGLKGLPHFLSNRFAARIADLPAGTEKLFSFKPDFVTDFFPKLARHVGFSGTFHSLRSGAGTQVAEARAEAAGADYLDHSDPRIFRRHYANAARLARAVAKQIAEPEGLPPLPSRDE